MLINSDLVSTSSKEDIEIMKTQNWVNSVLIPDISKTMGRAINETEINSVQIIQGIAVIKYNEDLISQYLQLKSNQLNGFYPHYKGKLLIDGVPSRPFLTQDNYRFLYSESNKLLDEFALLINNGGFAEFISKIEIVGSDYLTSFVPNQSDMDLVVTLNDTWKSISDIQLELIKKVPKSNLLSIARGIHATQLQIFFMAKDTNGIEFETGLQFSPN